MRDNDVSPTPAGGGDLSSSGELELPPTPTKKVYSSFSSLFGNAGGTKRKGECKLPPGVVQFHREVAAETCSIEF